LERKRIKRTRIRKEEEDEGGRREGNFCLILVTYLIDERLF
jgi:hypothetical protein